MRSKLAFERQLTTANSHYRAFTMQVKFFQPRCAVALGRDQARALSATRCSRSGQATAVTATNGAHLIAAR
jgi:hypothetical protein